jgi:HPt (histidine-containing phosphotransfer) domain-containing protein/HAMP domain-containing protein
MGILEPLVDVVGRLSFRAKLRITALVFGLPLLVAAGVLLAELNARVSALQEERTALAVQVPVNALAAELHQLQAARQAMQEGATGLDEFAAARLASARAAMRTLRAEFAERNIRMADRPGTEPLLGQWDALAKRVGEGDLGETIAGLRSDLDRLNEETGLLIDGDASTSRLLDVMTGHYAALVRTTGTAATLGSVTLAKHSLRGSRRSELTMQRGNFNALVQWSMEALQKVAQEKPRLAAGLEDAGGRLNTAYLAIQEALTTKMLDTSDFDMEPAAFLALTQTAFAETVAIGDAIARATGVLLDDRLATLSMERNVVILAILVVLALVVTGFVAAYISIMRAVNGLSDAVSTMASGDLGARVDVTTRDELGDVGLQFNEMARSLAERTAQLREKSNDIHTLLLHMPQGVLTIVEGGVIHPEYSAYLENIFETDEVAGRCALDFLFGRSRIGADGRAQIEATLSACLGEDRLNFDCNAHLLVNEAAGAMADGRVKILEFGWSPICDEHSVVEKIMVCVRDVTELRQLEAEARQQRRELEMIGQILGVQQEKFNDFIENSRRFAMENEKLLREAGDAPPERVAQLFRNMHTIKGNARTYGLLHLTNVAHEAEQAYDELRRNGGQSFDRERLLGQLQAVTGSIGHYAALNEEKLGRKGPGRRASAEKYYMVPRAEIEQLRAELDAVDPRSAHRDALAAALGRARARLHLIGTETLRDILAGVFSSLPSLARELGKEAPRLAVDDGGVHIRTPATDLLRNVFMHLYRNSMDHGIETAAERVGAGKPPAGEIRLDASLAGERLVLRLRDDGKGLALGHIRRQATARGLLAEASAGSDEDAAKLIFAAGFSTAKAVTEVSGRGVGMDAVRDFVVREGGDIRLRFTDDRAGADYRAFETVITLPARLATRPAVPAAGHPPANSGAGAAGESPGIVDSLLSLGGKLAHAS